MNNVAKKEFALELVRSDLGDGGWSLHAKREDLLDNPMCDSQDCYPLLVSGESKAGPDGEWLRPKKADYAAAQKKARELAKRFPLEIA